MATRGREGTAKTGFGVDVGGSGIKGAPVDLLDGSLADERHRIETPPGARPDEVVDVIVAVLRSFGWTGPFGCTFPGIVRHGVIGSAANVDDSWIGVDLATRLSEATGQPAVVVNDADAAGLAESHWGAARDREGVVLVTTLGTGIGTALLVDGHLVPNTELGHLELDGKAAERRAASAVRERKGLTWEEWAARLQRYYEHLEFLFSPDLFVVGGGVSKKAEKFLPLLDLRTEIVPAGLLNEAGIVGAAALAADTLPAPHRRRRTKEVPA
jgi:polyphosphate glucokinase